MQPEAVAVCGLTPDFPARQNPVPGPVGARIGPYGLRRMVRTCSLGGARPDPSDRPQAALPKRATL